MTTTKKNIKVKKGKGDISITIENNLNANNKQINHQPKAEGFIKPGVLKRRRRKKKVENNDEESLKEQSLQELPPLKDVSYIKPGPVGAFKIWRDTMDSYNTTVPMNQAQQLGLVPPQLPAPPTQQALPAPPVQLALPAPEQQQQAISFDNFARFLTMMVDNQRSTRPPPEWGRNLVDDEDSDDDNVGPVIRSVPLSPVTSFSQRSLPPTPMRRERDDNLNQSIASVYGVKSDDPEIPAVNEEVKKILTLTAARAQGTKHGKKNIPPQGDYKDMPEYQENYNKAKQSLLPKPIIPGAGKTRGQKKELSKGQTISTSPEVRKFGTKNPKSEARILQDEITSINLSMPDFGDFENWNEEKELAKAGLKPIIMTNEDAEDAEAETNRLLFGT